MKVDRVQKAEESKLRKRRRRQAKPGSPEHMRERILSHIISDPTIVGSSKISVNIMVVRRRSGGFM